MTAQKYIEIYLMDMLRIYWNIKIYANGRKKTLLSLWKQQENP